MENIIIAREKSPGTAEEALLAFLQDEKNSFNYRTQVSKWTLEMLKQEADLPVQR